MSDTGQAVLRTDSEIWCRAQVGADLRAIVQQQRQHIAL